jgi:hypothetical protein
MNIQKLSNNDLMREYKSIRMLFIILSDNSKEHLFNNLWNEVKNRNLDLRLYY